MPRASTFASPKLLIPLAALLAVLPLLLHGNSCGQDLAFHLQSWIDAAQQLRHGHYPRWDATAAWNAGEPRFLFYPPLSWLLGAALTLTLPIVLPTNAALNAAPVALIFVVLAASGLTFHHLARRFASPRAALIASALYLANPYMLFNAFERSAFAELLAAAWIPLLLLAILRPRPTARGIAIPLALLWLTNVPAAVMGSYLLALLATLRVLFCLCFSNCPSERSEEPASRAQRVRSSLHLALTCIAGTFLGLALPAFYVIPAATERPLIQASMALLPPLRFQDNFLFTHTPDAAHNAVNHTASLLALTLLLSAIAALLALLLIQNQTMSVVSTKGRITQNSVISTGAKRLYRFAQWRDLHPTPNLALTLILSTLLIAFLLTPLSTPIWRHLPELAFLQFPWRLLTLLTPILALAIALLLDQCFFSLPKTRLSQPPQIPSSRPESAHFTDAVERPLYSAGARSTKEPRSGIALAAILTLALPLTLSLAAHHLYSQPCGPADTPAILTHNLTTHRGAIPTDEYTPSTADNDLLRTGNPAFWLAPLTNPNAPAPHTHPTATELNPSIDTDDTPIPLSQALSTPAPHHLTLNLPHPAILVLNLRDYPNWDVTYTDPDFTSIDNPVHVPRSDGLIGIPLYYPSDYTIDIAWHRSPDQTLGLIISAVALLTLALMFRRDY